MTRVGVLTSGGDAPGMNAAIRSVVRSGIDGAGRYMVFDTDIAGSSMGCSPLLAREASAASFGRGGTILGSARAPEFQRGGGCLP